LALILILLVLPTNALAQNYTKQFQNFSNLSGKFFEGIKNLHNALTSQQCDKARQLYPTSHNVTIANTNISFSQLDIAIHACKVAGK
jgi:hypothetical protein